MKLRQLALATALTAAAAAGALTSTAAFAQAKEQFFPVLVYRTGAYGDPYQWSSQALKRAVDFMQRSGWGITSPATYVPWMANFRYGANYPAGPALGGRILSWGDWMYQR